MSSAFVQHVGYIDSLSVATSLCLTYTLLILGLRLIIRNKSWGTDDICVIVATVTALSHFAIDYFCLSQGLGKPYADYGEDDHDQWSSAVIAGVVTFILSIYLAKTTTLVFMMRIASVMRTRPLYWTCLATSIAFCIASILLVTVDCPIVSGYYWDLFGNFAGCPTQLRRWHVVTIFDLVSEVILLVLPVHLVWSLQMPRAKKGLVVTSFATRLPVIGLSLVRQHYVQQLLNASSDKGLTSTMVVIMMEIEVTYALASCTIATARNSMDNFNTGFGVGHIRGAAEEYNISNLESSTDRTAKSIKLRTLSSISTSKPSKAGQRLQRKPSVLSVLDGRQSKGYGMAFQTSDTGQNKAYRQPDRRRLSEDGSSGGESDELHILRRTEYTVSHDEVPILPESNGKY